ncbi:MAG: hypothetical protein J0H30_03190, partial [Alphaproteobacteria bacterium]|nr:hypothetical protein [Alphaproteobacteria bacterium]
MFAPVKTNWMLGFLRLSLERAAAVFPFVASATPQQATPLIFTRTTRRAVATNHELNLVQIQPTAAVVKVTSAG